MFRLAYICFQNKRSARFLRENLMAQEELPFRPVICQPRRLRRHIFQASLGLCLFNLIVLLFFWTLEPLLDFHYFSDNFSGVLRFASAASQETLKDFTESSSNETGTRV